MPETHSYGSGVFPSLAWHDGTWWLASQDHAWIHVWRDRERVQTIQMSGPDAAFPKIASFDGTLWLIYREGATGRLINLTTGAAQEFGRPHGNNPHLLADGAVWWQEHGGIWRAPLADVRGKTQVSSRMTPTGITGILNGQPLYWDDVRGSQPGMIQPTFAGDYCAGEGPHGGTVVRHLPSGRELWLWPGSIAFEPQCAWNGHELAVATWGEGVRRAIVQPHELLEPQPVPTPEPEPSPIPTPEPEPPAMKMRLPEDVYETFRKVTEQFPHTHPEDEQQRREAMKKSVATVRAIHGERYCTKTEHNTGYANQSTDALCYVPSGPVIEGQRVDMFIWDMVDGTSLQPEYPGDSEDLRKAYILAPQAKNWLTGEEPAQPPNGIQPGQKHAYVRDDEERDECDIRFTDGTQCDQPRGAAVHQVAPGPNPVPVGDLARIESKIDRLLSVFRV